MSSKQAYKKAQMVVARLIEAHDPFMDSTMDLVKEILKGLGFKEPNGR